MTRINDYVYTTPQGGFMQFMPPTWSDPNTELLREVQELQAQRKSYNAPLVNRAQRRARRRKS